MKQYRAIEFSITDTNIVETGREESYLANSHKEAVSHCLYTHKLHNGNAVIGRTGRVIYCGKLAYTIIE